MAFIEQFEIDTIKQTLKKPIVYILSLIFASSLYFLEPDLNLYLLVALGFVFSLILVVDIKEYIIPDSTQILIFFISSGLIYTSADKSLLISVVGLLFASAMFGGIYYVYEKIIKKSALGFGDVKLFANMGFLLGVTAFNQFLWILTATSCLFLLVRLLFKPKNKLIPYGPFIVISAWICILFEKSLTELNYNVMTYIMS